MRPRHMKTKRRSYSCSSSRIAILPCKIITSTKWGLARHQAPSTNKHQNNHNHEP
jgi:hypothetical protein